MFLVFVEVKIFYILKCKEQNSFLKYLLYYSVTLDGDCWMEVAVLVLYALPSLVQCHPLQPLCHFCSRTIALISQNPQQHAITQPNES